MATGQARAKPDTESQDKEIYAWSITFDDDYFPQYQGLTSFLDSLTPTVRREKIIKAKQYRNVDVIDRILHFYMEFARKPKAIKCKNVSQRKFYEKNVLPMLREYYTKWVYERHSIGDVFNHFGFDPSDNKTPMFLLSENPVAVDVVNVFGNEYYKLKVAPNLKNIFNLLKQKQVNIDAILAAGVVTQDLNPDIKQEVLDTLKQIPLHILRALSTNSNGILVINQENMYRSANAKPDYCLYSEPPLMKIAEAIELRRLLTASDFRSAMKKRNIVHTQVGNEKDPKSMNPDTIKDVHNKLTTQTDNDIYLTTGPNVKINPIDPDIKSWGKEKYEESNSRILTWAGLTASFTVGNGNAGAYGSAIVGTKGLQAIIDSDVEVFDEFVEHFFDEINKRNHFSGNISVEYEPNRLIDSSELLALVQWLVNMGIMAYEDACKFYDFDPDEQLAKKKSDNEKVLGVAKPWFEDHQNLLADGSGDTGNSTDVGKSGRPKTTPGPIRNTNQPKPSQ